MTIFSYAFFGFCAFFLAFLVFAFVLNLGFKPPKKTRINESVPLNASGAVKIYEQDPITGEWFSTLVESQESSAFLEYIDRLSGFNLEHFIVPVKYNPKSNQWESRT